MTGNLLTPQYIDNPGHKAYDCLAAGSESGSYCTVVEVIRTSIPMVPEVRLDRPILFSIRERRTETVLFIGKMWRPD